MLPGDFISEKNLSSILRSLSDTLRALGSNLGGEHGSRRRLATLERVCDLLSSLQACNRACWRADHARGILLALFKLDCAMPAGKGSQRSP